MKQIYKKIWLCSAVLIFQAAFGAFRGATRLARPTARVVRQARPVRPLPAQQARVRYPVSVTQTEMQPSLSQVPGRLPSVTPPFSRVQVPSEPASIPLQAPTQPMPIQRSVAPKREVPQVGPEQLLLNELSSKQAELAEARRAQQLRQEGTFWQRMWQGGKNMLGEGAYERVQRLEREVKQLNEQLGPYLEKQAELQAQQRAAYLKQLPQQMKQEMEKLIELTQSEMQLKKLMYGDNTSKLHEALKNVYAMFEDSFIRLRNRYKTQDPLTTETFDEVWLELGGATKGNLFKDIAAGKQPVKALSLDKKQSMPQLLQPKKLSQPKPSQPKLSQSKPSDSPYVSAPRPAETGLPRFIPREARKSIQEQTFKQLERTQVPKAERPAMRAEIYKNIGRNMIEQAQTGGAPQFVVRQLAQQPKALPAPKKVETSKTLQRMPKVRPTKRRLATAAETLSPVRQQLQQQPQIVDIFAVKPPVNQSFIEKIMQGKQEPFMLVQSQPATRQQAAQVSVHARNPQGLIDTLIINPMQADPVVQRLVRPLLHNEPLQVALYNPKALTAKPMQNALQQLVTALNDRQTVGITSRSKPAAQKVAQVTAPAQQKMLTAQQKPQPSPVQAVSLPAPRGVAQPKRIQRIQPQRVVREQWQAPEQAVQMIRPATGIAQPQVVRAVQPQQSVCETWTLPAAAAAKKIALKQEAPMRPKQPRRKPVKPQEQIAMQRPKVSPSEKPLSPKLQKQKVDAPKKLPHPAIALLEQIKILVLQNEVLSEAIINQLLSFKGLVRMLRAYNNQLRIITRVIPKAAQNAQDQMLYTSEQSLEHIKNDIVQAIDIILKQLKG